MTEQSATEHLLALELAREARRRRRNRVLVWLAILVAIAAAVYFGVVRPAQERERAEDARVDAMFCDMMYGFGTEAYERCIED